jgi:hypothetical protein
MHCSQGYTYTRALRIAGREIRSKIRQNRWRVPIELLGFSQFQVKRQPLMKKSCFRCFELPLDLGQVNRNAHLVHNLW